MRFQVPQFIEIEDKIFGPLTLKQFIYLAGGGGLSFMVYIFLNNLFLSALPILIIVGISGLLAFFKINNKPLINVIESAYKYYVGDKLYIWKKVANPQPTIEPATTNDMKNYASIMVPKMSNSKLKDLTWSLDVQDSRYANKNSKSNNR
ncbi:MAG: PrgI family protein [Candidatus Taylorbacteria bacterium]